MARILPPTSDSLAEAAATLRAGGLVSFPTETVYGLGANATDERAITRLYEAKGRPSCNPLIIHFVSFDAARPHVESPPAAEHLAAAFWPGPLTMVLPRRIESPLSRRASAGLPTIAIRVPSHPLARAFLDQSGLPVAAPSANRSGLLSPTRANHVADSLGARIDIILDGGPCAVGVESTVIDMSGEKPVLLRPGGIPRRHLEECMGPLALSTDAKETPKSPGQLLSHYATRLPVRLNADQAAPGEALLGFGAIDGTEYTLSASGDLVEAAANLFAMLHLLDDASRFHGIAVAPIPDHGLGLAINDRLRRAAAPRFFRGRRGLEPE